MKSIGSTPDTKGLESGASAALPFDMPARESVGFPSKARILVIAGHYGSGKTEIALNLAVALKPTSPEIALIDLDIVNPFFRSAEQERMLLSHGIETLKPIYANTGVDIPSLPPDILAVFARERLRAVFDVGGDDAGAAALGGYAPQFARVEKTFYMVVNPFRPRSETVAQIVSMYEAISGRARMRPDAIIANPNLGDETTPETISQGLSVVHKAAAECGVPIACVCAKEDICASLSNEALPVFPIRRYLKPEWMEA